MSVVEYKRTKGKPKLRVITAAIENCKHTLRVCKSEKHFPKRNRWLITNDIVQESKDALKCCVRANNITVKDYKDFHDRRSLQMEAKGHAETQLILMQVAFELLNFDLSMDKWVGLVDKLLTLLSSWMDSDRSRYRDIIKQFYCLSDDETG